MSDAVASLQGSGHAYPPKTLAGALIGSARVLTTGILELTQFTDRELEDLGISRYEIDLVAHRNAVSSTTS
jgi:uncharacterized protein YjiS (DUF1127 family)